MANKTDSTDKKASRLERFNLSFEFNQTIADARKSTRLRTQKH